MQHIEPRDLGECAEHALYIAYIEDKCSRYCLNLFAYVCCASQEDTAAIERWSSSHSKYSGHGTVANFAQQIVQHIIPEYTAHRVEEILTADGSTSITDTDWDDACAWMSKTSTWTKVATEIDNMWEKEFKSNLETTNLNLRHHGQRTVAAVLNQRTDEL